MQCVTKRVDTELYGREFTIIGVYLLVLIYSGEQTLAARKQQRTIYLLRAVNLCA